jgi:hypothetical protein
MLGNGSGAFAGAVTVTLSTVFFGARASTVAAGRLDSAGWDRSPAGGTCAALCHAASAPTQTVSALIAVRINAIASLQFSRTHGGGQPAMNGAFAAGLFW